MELGELFVLFFLAILNDYNIKCFTQFIFQDKETIDHQLQLNFVCYQTIYKQKKELVVLLLNFLKILIFAKMINLNFNLIHFIHLTKYENSLTIECLSLMCNFKL